MKIALGVTVILVLSVMAIAALFSGAPGAAEESPKVCSMSAFVGEPLAVIKPLPEFVSNGTPTALDGSGSSDADGVITSYSWKISAVGLSTNLTGIAITYTFTVLTIYTIELTVTDNESKTGTTSTQVETVTDSDSDALPDWWEQKYFGNLAQGPNDDYDSDGYLNQKELEDDMNPTVKDAGPSTLSKIPVWAYAVAAAGVAAVLLLLFWPKIRQRQKEKEKKKIEYALEIEKALGTRSRCFRGSAGPPRGQRPRSTPRISRACRL